MFDAMPEDWSQEPLGAVAEVILGQSPPSSVVNTDGVGLPFIQGNAEFGPRHPSPVLFASDAPKEADAGDVLLSVRAPVGQVNVAERPLAIGRGVAALRARACDPEFLFHAVGGLQPAFARLSQGSTFDAINGKELRQLPIALPPLDEQRRIAEVLRSVDEAIAASEAATNQFGKVIEQQANAVVANLFAEEVVTKVRIGDIALVKGGKRLPKGSSYEETPTANRYIRVTDWADYQIDASDVRYLSDEVAAAIRRYTISSDDLFISIAGSIGLVASVPPDLSGAYLTENAAKIVVCDKTAVDATYLLVALRSELLAEQIRQQKGVGGGVPKLALFRIEELCLPLPEIGVQREIAASYRSLKAARQRSANSLKAAIKLKANLADDLLTGRVRVPA